MEEVQFWWKTARKLRLHAFSEGKRQVLSPRSLARIEIAWKNIPDVESHRISFGCPSGPHIPLGSENPHDKLLWGFIEKIKFSYANTEVDEFGFSTSDSVFTRDEILKRAEYSQCNLVLACLNSKPAMVGACLAAMKHPAIQMVYAQPLYYNVDAYSSESGEILVFDVSQTAAGQSTISENIPSAV